MGTTLTRTTERGVLVVKLAGQLGGESRGSFETFFLQEIPSKNLPVIVDCSELQYLNSAGLRTFLKAKKQCSQMNLLFPACSLHSEVAQIFELAGFSKVIEIIPTLEETFSTLGAAA